MKQNSHCQLLIALAGLSIATPTHGQLFSDDFESYTADTQLGNSGPWSTAGIGTAGIFVRDEVTATPFGTPNQYLDLNDNDGSSVRIQSSNIAAASGAITTYSFDFNEPAAGGDGALIIGYSITGGDLNGPGSRLTVNLIEGSITGLSGGVSTYNLDTSYRIYVIFNDTAAAVSYNGGTESVAAGTADVWLEPSGGPAVYAGTSDTVNDQTASYRVGLRSYSSNLQQVLIDNVTLSEGVTLPGNPPVIVSTSPADDAQAVLASANLVANFNVPVMAGTGNITIKETLGDATVATFVATDPAVTFSGSSVTVDPPSDLDPGTGYYVLIDADAVENLSGDSYTGIIAPDVTAWNFKTGISALRNSIDSIRGRAQINGGTLDYLVDNGSGGQVGIGGGADARRDFNFVLGFTLPILPVGETVSAATFDFEIAQSRDQGNNPALHVYLLDTADPDNSGISFFYQGPGDPSLEVAFVGATNLVEPSTAQIAYADDEQDQSYAVTGDALALLQSYYGGDHIPERSEVFFRFNLDQLLGGATLNNFERYFIDTAGDESLLTIGSSAGGGSGGYNAWAAGFTPNPGDPTGNPDPDSLNNLLEYAFGTNPNVNDEDPLAADGSVNGTPIARVSGGGGGVDFDFLFVRRADFANPGSVTYTPQFSDDMMTFYDSSVPPIFVADSTDDADYEVVRVPYPFLLPNGKKARFARVKVEFTP